MVRHLPNSAVNAHYLLAIRSRLCLAVAWLLVLSNLATAQTKPSSFKPSPTDKTTNKTAKTATTNKKPNPNSSTTAITASNITAPNMRAVEGENQRFVHVPKATVRCGPGTDYYPTGLLSKGTSVEVYVETDDGWSGIRPPKGSHNWVQADALYLLPGGRVGEVAVDTTPAWIGSDASKNEKLLYQTDLVKSQTVAIQGEAYRGQDDDKKLWFRIAPPQGEFRWVKTSMLGKDPVPPESKELTSTSNKDPKSVSTANYLAPQGKGAKPAVRTTSQMEPQDPIEASEAPPSKGKLAWSDEAEQTERVSQEIRREQQKIEQEIRASGLPSKAKSSLLAKTPRQAPSANFDGASVKPTAKPSE